MPVYIRKGQLEVPLPSPDGRDDNNDGVDAGFELDPERAFARPPQPRRLVAKVPPFRVADDAERKLSETSVPSFQVLELVLERTWASIEERERNRQEERTRCKPPVWDRPGRAQLCEEVQCLASSVDGRYIFVGLDGGLTALAAEDEHPVLSTWEERGTMITQINTAPAGEQISAIATIDDMGLARLFAFHSETFHLVKIINEVEDISRRTLCSSFILSSRGDFGGIMLEGNGESWFEIQKIPKETWIKDLEQAQSQQQHDVEQFSNIDVKLSSPTITLRLKSPKAPSGRERRPGQESSQLPEEWSTLGTGQNHVLSSAQLETHRLLFQQRHRDATEQQLSRATVHFVLPALILPAGLENKTASGLPNGVCMWWSGSHLLLHYNFQKTGKETEPKAEAVWPNAELICCSTISICTMLLALGLRDGTITIWDRYLGLPLTVMSLPEAVRIAELHFVAPKKHPAPPQHYATSPSASLLALCKDGSVQMVEVNSEGTCDIATICQRYEKQEDVITAVLPLPIFTQLIMTFTRGGRMALHDRMEGNVLALVALPVPYVVASPWHPVYTIAPSGHWLFVKGVTQRENGILPSSDSSGFLFIFPLRSIVDLDSHHQSGWSCGSCIEHITWDKRCEKLLLESIQSFADNDGEMEECWSALEALVKETQS